MVSDRHGSIQFPIYEDSFGALNVALPQDGTTLTLIPDSGTSNISQAEADAYLCFAAGTSIAAADGARTVEALVIGDRVLATDSAAVPVKWLGRQTVHKRFTPPDRFKPIRISAGALGIGLPCSGLILTGDHALILDGRAINASALVNGAGIDWVPRAALPERVTYPMSRPHSRGHPRQRRPGGNHCRLHRSQRLRQFRRIFRTLRRRADHRGNSDAPDLRRAACPAVGPGQDFRGKGGLIRPGREIQGSTRLPAPP